MANKTCKKRPYKRFNSFAPGGLEKVMGQAGNVLGGIQGMVSAGMNNAKIADTTGLEGQIDNTLNTQVIGSTTNSLLDQFNSFQDLNHVTAKDIRGLSAGNAIGNTIGGVTSGISSGMSVGGPIGGIIGGVVGLGSSIGGIFGGNRKARKKARQLNEAIDEAERIRMDTFNNAVDNQASNESLLAQQNFYAEGGNIYIKPSNRGKFTEYCGGDVTQECINRGKNSDSPIIRKRATFADNARKWHHAEGGFANPNISNYDSGVTVFNNGGTHEQNPNEGIPISVDPEGVPNLVEEGEIKYKDYIFSNRLKPTKKDLKALHLSSSPNKTFADIAKMYNKEAEERPNDPISRNGLEANMGKLQQIQEEMKSKRESRKHKNNIFALGGNPELETTALSNQINLLNPQGINLNQQSQNISGLRNFTSNTDHLPKEYNDNSSPNYASLLRYSPVVSSGIASLTDALGATNKSDYTQAEAIENAAKNFKDVKFNQIGNRLKYNPFDTNYYQSKLKGQAGATQRALVEQSGGNRATASANLLAQDYNTQSQIGNLARQAEEYNEAQRTKVAEFNRGTDMFNTEGDYKAQLANKQNEQLRYNAAVQAAGLRSKEDQASASARMANVNNFIDNLSSVGRESQDKEMIMALIESGVFGNLNESMGKATRTKKNKK